MEEIKSVEGAAHGALTLFYTHKFRCALSRPFCIGFGYVHLPYLDLLQYVYNSLFLNNVKNVRGELWK